MFACTMTSEVRRAKVAFRKTVPLIRLRACANRRATFRTWHLSEGLNSLLTTAWHIRYSPIGAASKPPSHKHRRERVLCQDVDHYYPYDDQHRTGNTVLGKGQNYGGCHRQRQADPWYEAQEESQNAPHQRKVNPQHQQQHSDTSSRNKVDYGAQPELAHHVPAEDGQPSDLRMVAVRAGAQAVHHSGSLCEKEQHVKQDQEQVAQEVGNA